jgi:hypothetical protein
MRVRRVAGKLSLDYLVCVSNALLIVRPEPFVGNLGAGEHLEMVGMANAVSRIDVNPDGFHRTILSVNFPSIPREILMRIPALAILATVTVLMAAPSMAQTYSPDYPVCLQAYGDKGDYIECRYTSLAQCAMSASGRSAQCIINPYYASAQAPREPHYRRHSRVY